MTLQTLTPTSKWSSDLESLIGQLRDDMIEGALPGLAVADLALLSYIVVHRGEPVRLVVTVAGLLALALAVRQLRKRSYPAAAWTLVIGALAADLLVAAWVGFAPAIYLLALPVGLAALLLSRWTGFALAMGMTPLLLFAPASFLQMPAPQRVVAVLGVWATVGLIWLTLRPLVTAVQWAWSGYEQSQAALDQAQEYQVQLKQALEDLAHANVQLTRLNHQAEGLRQAAEDARRAAKEQFVANVSHELRTPLNMITGFCEMIVQTPESYAGDVPPALLADLDVVLRNSEHLASLVDDVLDLSQIDAGRMALAREWVAMDELAQAAAVAVQPLFRTKGLYLETEVPGALPRVWCDRTRIREVLLNLLSNAGRFTEHGGVRVTAWQEDGGLVLSVSDTGPGIAEADLGRLFQPFQQLDGSIRRRFAGTGLGLSISRSFVALHGGKMWVESEPGRGTTFSFSLPIDPPMPPEGSALRWINPYEAYEQRTRPSRLQPAAIRPRVIVVESGGSLQRLLGRYGEDLEIVSLARLEQAKQALADAPAQALLINSLRIGETLQQLSEWDIPPYGTPALLCSIPGLEETAGVIGIANYLVKPVQRETLLTAIDGLGIEVRSLLLVDDEPDALQLFRRMLAAGERNYQVFRASDGRQALQILKTQRPDVILLDLVMPEMDGFEFLAAKSEAPDWRDIPVILISARDPRGQPIVSNALAVTSKDGLTAQQLLDAIESLSGILSLAGPIGGPGLTTRLPG